MEQVTETPVVVLPTSEKLTQLKADKKAAFDKLRGIDDIDSKEWLDANLEVFKIGKLIDAEVSAIKSTEAEKRTAELRNERIKLNQTQLDAHQHMLKVHASKATADEKQTATDAFTTAKEAVENELLAKYAKTSVAKTTDGAAKSTGTKGATGTEIVALYETNKAAGMNDTDNKKAIIAAGYSRGTTGAVVLAHQREQGVK